MSPAPKNNPRRRAAFLDRDGVLNRAIVRDGKPYPPSNPEECEILDEAREACQILRSVGFMLICVTNQPDIGRGSVPASSVDELNSIIRDALDLDEVRVCPHDDSDGCDCRKPRPGMLLDAATAHGIDLKSSYMVGDRWRDIDAGRSAGCLTVFIDRGYRERRPESPDFITTSLVEAARWIVGRAIVTNQRINQ
jgi:D-glycero-D-manno-heptose 1,7-bisphosphate phosphatase